MKPVSTTTTAATADKETELKLALPTQDPGSLYQALARAPVLNRRKPTRQQLHSVYFDTPGQDLRRQEAALRIRRVETSGEPLWVQTLKTGKRARSALSQRGEWESAVAGPALEFDALDPVAWSRVDPRGDVYAALAPLFATDFTRTIWMVRRRDGSVVEVALDIGSVRVGTRTAPICELELELKAGPVSALFDLALQIAARVPVLPMAMSKAQRGLALAADAIDAPVKADPPRLKAGMSLHATARSVLTEMFGQFCANLNTLRQCDDPELVHQARVAWRRFRSARKLFKSVLAGSDMPPWHVMAPLLALLGQLRDLDVALGQTLPALRDDYVVQDGPRAQAWAATLQALTQAAATQRRDVRHALEDPAVGVCLLQTTRWLEQLGASGDADGDGNVDGKQDHHAPKLRQWAERRAGQLHRRLAQAREHGHDALSPHGLRILAKRTRYGIEALRDVLPQRTARKWCRQAADLQQSIGDDRDIEQAITLLARCAAPADVIAFLRGVATGRRLR